MTKSQVVVISLSSAMIANLLAVSGVFMQAGGKLEIIDTTHNRLNSLEDKVERIEQSAVANRLEAVNASLANRGEIMALKTDLTAIRESLNRIERKLP